MRALRALALVLLCALLAAPFALAALGRAGPDRVAALLGLGETRASPPLPAEGALWPLLADGLGGLLPAGLAVARDLGPAHALPVLLCLLALAWTSLREPSDRTRRAARGLRAGLLLLSLLAAGSALGAIARLADRVVREPILAPPTDDRAIADTLVAELRWVLSLEGPDRRIREALEACDPGLAGALAAAARLAGRPPAPETDAALAEAESVLARSRCALADAPCVATGEGCRTTAGLAAAFAVRLTSAGDVLDLARELLWRDEPDPLIVGLAALGIALKAAELAAPVPVLRLDAARAALKVIHRGRLLDLALVRATGRLLDEAIDRPALLAAVRRLDREAVARAVRLERLGPLATAGDDLLTIARAGGRRTALLAATSARSLDELGALRRVATALGDDTAGALATLGRGWRRAFHVYRAAAPTLRAARLRAAQLAASLVGVVLALARAPAEWLLRRRLRALARAGAGAGAQRSPAPGPVPPPPPAA